MSSSRLPVLLLLAGLTCCSAQDSTLNVSMVLGVLAREWRGSGYADGGGPSYMYFPKPMTVSECQPMTGRPSICPVDQLQLILQEPPGAPVNSELKLNLTMRFYGDVFESSPGSKGYFGMPDGCRYERNHSVMAYFNASSGRVRFDIYKTTSDYLACQMNFGATSTDHMDWNTIYTSSTNPFQRCTNQNCYVNLNNVASFSGIFKVMPRTSTDPLGATYRMDLAISFPYLQSGKTSFSDYDKRFTNPYTLAQVANQPTVSSFATSSSNQIFYYSLTWSEPFHGPNDAWFMNYMARITSIDPPFGPQEGGTYITVYGADFPSTDATHTRNASIVLYHSGAAGEPRACCESQRLSNSQYLCRLPRVSCLNNNPSFPCPQPGQIFQNQSVAIGIRPNVKGYDGTILSSKLDDFIEYEGTWELVDEDVYGGKYIPSTSRFTITQTEPGIYNVTIPAIMSPGSGVCDRATNLKNVSFIAAIDRSTDPYSASSPLSITSCIDQTGTCSTTDRISIRSTCNQLYWSLGQITSTLPAGQTVQIHQWNTRSLCERRMRCVAGPCKWTYLAQVLESQRMFQRRTASPQVGIYTQYPTSDFDVQGFLKELAILINAQDYRRLQLVTLQSTASLLKPSLGSLFAVRTYQKSTAALCIPNAIGGACADFNMIIYIVSEGPAGLPAQVSLNNLTARAQAATGDPALRMLNIMNVYVDQGIDPEDTTARLVNTIKVQYPGFLQFETTMLRVKELVWSYAKLGVTRTGGSDLSVTVRYETVQLNGTFAAQGLGVDYVSKQGQLRWRQGDSSTKYIIIPIYDDILMEQNEFLQVRIFQAVNATLISDPQFATVTIVGMNDIPTPGFIPNMQAIIGAVCGAASTLPCVLFAARLIRSFRKGKTKRGELMEQDFMDGNDGSAAF
ncbi:hypothetical protein GUITHDRAFT_139625 [Guillardia theta CCMP2712]|uniref:Calx-beta domain-containing protein n=1 Tax=Guillardia theta (strain CCMP2712) TaxID=905079 RepID=L1J843_GUITC|nr:hypothetical protein GUITHDRAFT_139625 [Guillardia theta CCMP2712]EKX44701.1 hypothetical protein GUITHDRAFT_139625 [Guillardia theta CCMP2712]|eukprot:XP_005831681.1 hypothetical protein GUITHDRAFT_139625 [Guillardia theta CCMP2712]